MPEFFISTFWFICYILFFLKKNRSHRFCFPCSILVFKKYPTLVDKTAINKQHFPPCHFWRTQVNAFSEHLSFCIADISKVPTPSYSMSSLRFPLEGNMDQKLVPIQFQGWRKSPLCLFPWINVIDLILTTSPHCYLNDAHVSQWTPFSTRLHGAFSPSDFY